MRVDRQSSASLTASKSRLGSFSRQVFLLTSMGHQVDGCKLKNTNAERVEQGKNPQDDAGLLSFAFFWSLKSKVVSATVSASLELYSQVVAPSPHSRPQEGP